MFKDLLVILTVDDLAELTMNSDLETLCLEEPNKAEKYINQITAKVWTMIDKDQFLENDEYIIPDDLKIAVGNLIDSYYTYSIVGKNNAGSSKKTSYSEKIDDYSISESYAESNSSSAYSLFGIPIDKSSLFILMSYMNDEPWFWNVNLH